MGRTYHLGKWEVWSGSCYASGLCPQPTALHPGAIRWAAGTSLVCYPMLIRTPRRSVTVWQAGMERKGLQVNTKKTKFMVFGVGHDVLKKLGKYYRAICYSGVVSGSQWKLWVHNGCSGTTKWLVAHPNYACLRCNDKVRPINDRTLTEVDVDGTTLDVNATFCYGDMLWFGGGCDSAIAARCCMAWGKFRKLLPVQTTRHLLPKIHGMVFRPAFAPPCSTVAKHGDQTPLTCSRSVEMTSPWSVRFVAPKTETKHHQLHYYRNLIGIKGITAVLCTRRFRWYGYVERTTPSIKSVTDFPIPGARKRGRPSQARCKCVKIVVKNCGLAGVDPQDREARGAVRRCLALPTP